MIWQLFIWLLVTIGGSLLLAFVVELLVMLFAAALWHPNQRKGPR